MAGRAVDLINRIDKKMRSLRVIVRENRNTKVEIKEIVGNISSMISQLSAREVLDNLEERIESREITMVEETADIGCQTDEQVSVVKSYRSIGTQTDRSAWQIRNENLASNIRVKIGASRRYEGFKKLSSLEWPQETFTYVRELVGNSIWDNNEQDIAILTEKGNLMDKGTYRQVRRRFPEVIDMCPDQEGCVCIIYEAKIMSNTEQSFKGRKTLSKVILEDEEMITYVNILNRKEKAEQLGIGRVAVLETESGWKNIKEMMEHAFWGSNVKIMAYSTQSRKKAGGAAESMNKASVNRNPRKWKNMESEAVVVSTTGK